MISRQSITGEQHEKNVENFERRHLRVLSRRSSSRNKVHGPTSTMLQILHSVDCYIELLQYVIWSPHIHVQVVTKPDKFSSAVKNDETLFLNLIIDVLQKVK